VISEIDYYFQSTKQYKTSTSLEKNALISTQRLVSTERKC